ncbi:fimbria/pilus periplasmic chaperone [Enterobacter cloacae subsp. cloacae]|uniref:fimbrial biogenesis chaperone n=1 Tax=Enterobacter cloacae TaxID=550 RepID=UPI001C5B1B67|nr:fimbria/pilus periplasmic chaperone [Enterobacter cloacae]MBW4204107.1 fimbria/pilus periplasmic chaperone [Enterobacter cloacae subsp. cloacae]
MIHFKKQIVTLAAAALMTTSLSAVAATVISSTRVIYPAQDREVTVQISNQGKGPVLLQSWIDDGRADASPDTLQVPFVLTPPVNRIDPAKSQSVRIRYTGRGLPADRESLLWFNALEVPPKLQGSESKNYLQMAFRTRIKLLFRPAGLKGTPDKAAQGLRWQVSGNRITAINDTPWHVSLVDVETAQNGRKVVTEADTVPPYGSQTFTVSSASAGTVTAWRSVNDYGAVRQYPEEKK